VLSHVTEDGVLLNWIRFVHSVVTVIIHRVLSALLTVYIFNINSIKQGPTYPASENFASESQTVSLVPAAWHGSKIIAPHLQLVDFTSFVAISNQSNKSVCFHV